MSPLERRSRLLMRAYPAAYRRERGDEIIATLLEATPAGRRRPLARDMRALILGGLRARAAQNRCFTTAVSLRVAVLAGVSIYLGVTAAGDLSAFLTSELDRTVPMVGPFGWPDLLAGLLVGAAVALAWLASRPVVTGAALAAAAVASYGFSQAATTSYLVAQLVCLVAVVALTGGIERRSPAWLWLIGVVVAGLVLPGYLQYVNYHWVPIALGLKLCVVVIPVAWVAIDGRPLVAVATYLLLWTLPSTLDNLAAGVGNWFDSPPLLVAAVIAALAVWRLRRQSLQPDHAVQ